MTAATNAHQFRPDIIRRLDRSRQFITTRFERHITLDDMAAQACMSSAHFLRQFKQRFAITPYQFLTQCRLQAAENLLLNSETAITDIVFASGFGNRSAFSRLFKERYGVSPLEFRRLGTSPHISRVSLFDSGFHWNMDGS